MRKGAGEVADTGAPDVSDAFELRRQHPAQLGQRPAREAPRGLHARAVQDEVDAAVLARATWAMAASTAAASVASAAPVGDLAAGGRPARTPPLARGPVASHRASSGRRAPLRAISAS